ncbi:uncharacterized protein LOC135708856 [Ochlerotatus camptorhynchus]|uniref:uncharacterized protein LOC135708856 n=1 Tax=Ochlerotatus camptorhynchus TaxID=644619 RepID=UPI0031D4C6C9
MLSRRKKKNKQLEDMFDKGKSDSDSYEEFEYLRNEVREGKTSTPVGTSSSGSFSPSSIGSPCPGSVVGVAMKIIGEGSAAGGGVSSSVTYSKCEKLNNGKQQHQQSVVTMGTKVGVSNGTFASGGSLRSHCSEKLKLSSENGKQAPAMDDDPDEIDGYCPVEVLKSEVNGEQKTDMSIIR